MRKVTTLFLALACCFALTGCQSGTSADDKALEVRTTMLSLESITGKAYLTADYGVRVYEYAADVTYWRGGDIAVTITAPENLAGITARLKDGASSISFDGMQVETGKLTTGGLSPMEAIPSLLKSAEEGYIAQTSFEILDGAEVLRVTYRAADGSPGVGEEATLWFDLMTNLPICGEILSDGYRVIGVTFAHLSTT